MVCFVLHCLHEYPSNVSFPVTFITIYKCLDFGLQRKSNVDTFLLKTSREHFHFGLTHVINIQQQWEKNTKAHHFSTKSTLLFDTENTLIFF